MLLKIVTMPVLMLMALNSYAITPATPELTWTRVLCFSKNQIGLSDTQKEQLKTFPLNEQQKERWKQTRLELVAYSKNEDGLPQASERAEVVASYLEEVVGLSLRTGSGWNPYRIRTVVDESAQVDSLTEKAPCDGSQEAVVLYSELYRRVTSNLSLNPDAPQAALRLARRYIYLIMVPALSD